MRIFYTIKEADVGADTVGFDGRSWPVCDFIGQILPGDVGKRAYLAPSLCHLQVENDRQRDTRALAAMSETPDAAVDVHCEDYGI